MNFLSGLAVGFALGILFAPMRGEELREKATQRAGELADTARDQLQEARKRAESAISAVRGETTGTEG